MYSILSLHSAHGWVREYMVYKELLRQLQNNEWQSCTQFSESEMQMPWDSQSMSASRIANGDDE